MRPLRRWLLGEADITEWSDRTYTAVDAVLVDLVSDPPVIVMRDGRKHEVSRPVAVRVAAALMQADTP